MYNSSNILLIKGLGLFPKSLLQVGKTIMFQLYYRTPLIYSKYKQLFFVYYFIYFRYDFIT